MIIFDQLNYKVVVPEKPRRIISLVPSQTELLHYLGLNERVIGITKFCIHPNEWHKSKTRIGGTKNLSIEKIKSLEPDLIIGNKEENEQVQIEELKRYFPVWMSDIYTLNDALNMIEQVGIITNTSARALQLVSEIKIRFLELINKSNSLKKVAYIIWNKPIIAAGKNTFIDDILSKSGFHNVIQEDRYPETSIEFLKEISLDYLFLSSEPFPYNEEHRILFQKLLPHTKVVLVDGEMFSWYGNRLLSLPSYIYCLNTAIK